MTIGELLAVGVAPVREVLGGENAKTREVTVVVPGTSTRAIGTLPAGALVVFDRDQLLAEDAAVDLAIRTGHRTRIAGIVAQQPERAISEATRRLAEKFAMPVLLLDQVEVGTVVAAFEPYVRSPAIAGAEFVRKVVTALSSVPEHSGELVRRLAGVLRFPVALVDTEGHVVAGEQTQEAASLRAVLEQLAGSPSARAAHRFHSESGDTVLVHTATVGATTSRNLWLVGWPPSGTSGHVLDSFEQSLAIGAIAFTAYLADRSLQFERGSRQRMLLLTEILERPEAPGRRVVERATAFGWRLSGWHTGVHIAIRGLATTQPADGLGALIEEALQGQHLSVSLVERSTGWAFWTTAEAEPTASDAGILAKTVRRALLVLDREEQVRLCAGIGSAHQGTGGIGRSLQEAEHASMLARTQETPAPVEHVDTASVKRLLVAWYSSGPLSDLVTSLLEPLHTADPTGELARTLRIYLDYESSATTAAAVLGVHRNTILNRLEKIQRSLPVDLSQPDQRLALQLAVHADATLQAPRSAGSP